MATILDLLKSSLRAIGQLGPGRSPGPSETADAVYVLNRMLSAWSIERLNVPYVQRAVQPLAAAQADYTIGPDALADYNTTRPIRLTDAGLMDGSIEIPLAVYTQAQWAAIGQKSLVSLPAGVYYEPTYPLGTLHVWPVPSAGSDLVLYTLEALIAVTDEDTVISLPPGYEEAITYNLAVRLGAEWSKPVRPDVLDLAHTSLTRIKSQNAPTLQSRCDAALVGRGGFDVMSGGYRR